MSNGELIINLVFSSFEKPITVIFFDWAMDDLPISELIRRKKEERKRKKGDVGESVKKPKFDEDTPLSEIFKRKLKKLKKKQSSSSSSSSKLERKSNRKPKDDPTIGDFPVHPAALYEQDLTLEPLKEVYSNVKWWENLKSSSDDKKWTSLKHNGVRFPPSYETHGIPVVYDGEDVFLTPEQEEIATFYAVILETEYVKNKTFRDNFFRDWQKVLGKGHKIVKLSKCDFSKIFRWNEERKERLKELRKDPVYKQQQKEEKAMIQETYGYAIVDGVRQKVGNFTIEPPGLFRGRGDHPKTGTLKHRIMPEDVIINVGKGEKIPRCPLPGHNWKGVVHNDTVTWLAFWMENVNNGKKYVWLHPSSQFKGQSDLDKYEKARTLKHHIKKIRSDYMRQMDDGDLEVRQRATAIWIIDVLALRAGNEKDTEDEADTVGCCSLRVEHVSFREPSFVKFDFLGKDSMRYLNEVQVHEKVYRNLRMFVKGKAADMQIFNLLNTTSLNMYLKSLMPGLTAKVFRTFNASVTLEEELRGPEKDIDVNKTVDEKLFYYNAANRTVAILCNHQKTISKTHDEQVDRMLDTLKKKKEQRKEIKLHLSKVLKGESTEDTSIKTKDPEILKNRVKKMDEMIKRLGVRKQLKEDNKSVALNTSKINYMDPRITVSWCKQKQIPIEKVFTKTVIERFPWAMEVTKLWRF